jgi:hypothetical protein
MPDAGMDAGRDAGSDAGSDAGRPDAGPPDAGSPNLIIRFTMSTAPVVLFIETSPFVSETRVALTPAMCIGGLRVVGGGVECLYATPLPVGTQIRFNFALVGSYPTMDDQWLCNGSSCPSFPGGYVVNFNGTDRPTATFGLQRLLDGSGVLTSFIGVGL